MHAINTNIQTPNGKVLAIAGFDPSAGAGVLADIKTFESFGVYGFGVCSALTFQNDTAFMGVQWVPVNQIIDQIIPLTNRFVIEFVKIGLIENIDVLEEIIEKLKIKFKNLKIVWDPILKASAGFSFHNSIDENKLIQTLQSTYLITPNIPEAIQLSSIENPANAAQWLAQYCNVLLKGGHSATNTATDLLYSNNNVTPFESPLLVSKQKHGTGCVLSSAIAANLAKGHSLEKACEKAKHHINVFISSTDGLLGKHNYTFVHE